MSLFKHRHQVVEGVDLYWSYEHSPSRSVGGTAAQATLCRCGAVLSRAITPNGWQQIGWGESEDAIFAALDRKIVQRLMLKERA